MARRAQRSAGAIALLLLLVTTLLVARVSPVRAPAVVAADQTFSVSSPALGRYAWRLESGRAPQSGGFVSERSLQSERSEIIDVSVPASVTTGRAVQVNEVVAELDSQRTLRRMEEQAQAREVLVAERELIVAGGRPEAIAAAERAVAVSEARRSEAEAALRRLAPLVDSGAVSVADLDKARLLTDTRTQEVALARASVAEVRNPPRAEELAALDAQLAAVDSRITEIATLLDNQQVRSPIAGVAEVGGEMLVRVYDLDPVFLHVAVSEVDLARVSEGDEATFASSALGTTFKGRVAEVASSVAIGIDGKPVILVTVEVPNPGRRLRAGMTGVVEFTHEGTVPRFASVAAAVGL